MKKIDLSELDQFGNVASSTSWNTNDIKSNQYKIDFGELWYIFDSNGGLVKWSELPDKQDITSSAP